MTFFRQQVRTLLLASAVAGVLGMSGGGGGSGTFTDTRDGYKYKTVKIGKQTWMAQNLNYQTGKSWCYGGSNSNCGKYGRLYDWNTAKTACPAGWHLPSREEWGALAKAAGGIGAYGGLGAAGKKLKARCGWNYNDSISGNGTDNFGFSALPGGCLCHGGVFGYAGDLGYWWTATEGDDNYAYYRYIYYRDSVGEEDYVKNRGLSVRCVAD